jgi:hypothetical protein
MKKILPIYMIFLLILTALNHTCAFAENPEIPWWVGELHGKINQTFQLQAKALSVKELDRIEQNKYFSFCIEGTGLLYEVPDPFDKMEKFFLSDGWKPDARYRADGHGSSSFAYEKGKYICQVSVWIDSSCGDEEEGHIPSEFWVAIYCREKGENRKVTP